VTYADKSVKAHLCFWRDRKRACAQDTRA